MAYHLSVVEIIHKINQQGYAAISETHTPEINITIFRQGKYAYLLIILSKPI
ncbi:MAG: hypothetical protein ACTS8H_04345 [Arsenophonus sp. NC-PE1-MAG3]